MLQHGENETEILLGNKQLLGIFFVVAALLGVAFTGGYVLGRGAKDKKPAMAAVTTPETAAAAQDATPHADAKGAQGGETHSIPAADAGSAYSPDADAAPAQTEAASAQPLGSKKHKQQAVDPEAAGPASTAVDKAAADNFSPQGGQEYLQVMAVVRNDATAVAAVLRKKGFPAHAVPKPGNPNLYRVIVGPIRDPGDLASTRDSLRKTGFRDVIVQHYQ